MHPIRRGILANLITSPNLPFSKLKPVDIESNIFMYHLKLLISEGLVKKLDDKKYALTTSGLIMAGNLSWKTFSTRIQPRIETMIVCKNKKGEYLLYKSRRQPTLDLIGFPYGKFHLGEKVLEAAQRELEEKSGLAADLVHIGEFYVTVRDGEDVVNQMLVHLHLGENPVGELRSPRETGECFWGKISSVSKGEMMPWFADVYKIASKGRQPFFFKEFSYEL